MGFLDRIFGGGKKQAEPVRTAEMMDEDRYWQMIADSLAASGGEQDPQIAYLYERLVKLAPAEIIGFRLRTDRLLYDTYTSELWCAGYIMNGGCSDDGFEYFRLWLISRGRDVFERAVKDPDTLVAVEGGSVEGFYDFERLWYVANDAFTSVTDKDLYEFIDEENFTTREGNYPDIEFTWTEEDDDSRKSICPRLYDRFDNDSYPPGSDPNQRPQPLEG